MYELWLIKGDGGKEKVSKIKVEYHFNYSDRRAEIGPEEFGRLVTVRQDASYWRNRDKKLEQPQINWSSVGGTDIETTDDFIKCLKRAVQIAKRWDKDTGKPCTEIKQIAAYRRMYNRAMARKQAISA
jgi:hypothetical protein